MHFNVYQYHVSQPPSWHFSGANPDIARQGRISALRDERWSGQFSEKAVVKPRERTLRLTSVAADRLHEDEVLSAAVLIATRHERYFRFWRLTDSADVA